MSNTVNVYWASFPDPNEKDWSILYKSPESLMSYLSKNKNESNKKNNFLRCPAFQNVAKNTFIIENTIESRAETIVKENMLSQEVEVDNENKPRWFINRGPSLQKNILLSSSLSWIFFSDEEVNMSISSPNFSYAPHTKYGAIVPGEFNIGSWFRPINLEFNLWENSSGMSIKENEHIAYLKFYTDKKIKLSRFVVSKTLYDIALSNATSTNWEPLVSIEKRYKRFRDSKLKDIILKEIKDNVV